MKNKNKVFLIRCLIHLYIKYGGAKLSYVQQ